MMRSDSGISAIFASTSASPAALSSPLRAAAFISLACAFIASRSSSVHTSVAVMGLAAACASFMSVAPLGQ